MNRALLYNRPVMTSPSITAVPAAVPAHVRERLRGIASMLAAAFSFAIMDALLKRISVHYAPLQVTFLRCVASLVCLSVPIAWRRSWSALRAQQPLLHIARGMLGILMLASFVFAVRRLTLAQTYSLFLAAPPNTPQKYVLALRKAFESAMSQPGSKKLYVFNNTVPGYYDGPLILPYIDQVLNKFVPIFQKVVNG